MNNPYCMQMIVNERQAEIRKQAALQRRLEKAGLESASSEVGPRILGVMGWALSALILGFLIVISMAV